MTRVMLSTAALILTAGTATAHTANAMHSHSEVVIAVGALVALGVIATRLIKRARLPRQNTSAIEGFDPSRVALS